MAKNIFVRGDFKRFREGMRKYKKDEQRLAQKLFVYSKEEKKFNSRDCTVLPRSTFLHQQYYLLLRKNLRMEEKMKRKKISNGNSVGY